MTCDLRLIGEDEEDAPSNTLFLTRADADDYGQGEYGAGKYRLFTVTVRPDLSTMTEDAA